MLSEYPDAFGGLASTEYPVLPWRMPNAQLFWLFCVSLCRELFEGEHTLKPIDAQLLGLVDEVAGGGPIETKREYRTRLATEKTEKGTNEEEEGSASG